MRARLEFGLKNAKGELWYSSDYELDFRVREIPPLGLKMRFDIPLFDDEGRWMKAQDGLYYIDGGSPIYAIVREVEAHVCDQTQSRITYLRVRLEVDEGGLMGRADEHVAKLIEFSEHLGYLKQAKRMRVSDPESDFSREQGDFLRERACRTVADAANLSLGLFHENEMSMVKSIETVLKEEHQLMFCAANCG